jgi:HEAT repeat protein
VPLTCLAIVLSTLAASPLSAPAPDRGKVIEGRSQCEAYLGTHDVAVAAELRALAKAPEDVLMAIASDTKVEGLIRSRAVAALRLVPSQGAHLFLGKLIQTKAKATDATDRLILRRAAVALGWIAGLGWRAGPGAAETLALLFDNEDAAVRLDAAIGLSLTRAEIAVTLLRRQLAVESVPRVRDQIERQLRALPESPPEPDKAHSPPMREPPMRGSW